MRLRAKPLRVKSLLLGYKMRAVCNHFSYGIHETGEFFEDMRVFCREVGLCRTAIDRHINTNTPWNGLHFVRFPRPRVCRFCGQPLVGVPENRGYVCNTCQNKEGVRWKKAHPDRTRELGRRQKRKQSYGLTHEQYQNLLVEQSGVCAICGQAERATCRGRLRSLAVDHDHRTGEVRGLLCAKCNVMLGNACDDPVVLQNAITYLGYPWGPRWVEGVDIKTSDGSFVWQP